MKTQRYVIDISRSYSYFFEGQSANLEIPNCTDYTYSFQTDEDRYIFLLQHFYDTQLIGIKFYRAADYERSHKYNVLTQHKNPFRFCSTIVNLIYREVVLQFPDDSFIFKGEPTLKEISEKKAHAERSTKRYWFYIRLLAELMSSLTYEARTDENKSIMVYMNKKLSPEAIKNVESFLAAYGIMLI